MYKGHSTFHYDLLPDPLTLEDMTLLKVVIQMCNTGDLKHEILSTPDNINKRQNTGRFCSPFEQTENEGQSRKSSWNEIIQEKVALEQQKLGLPETLKEKVTGLAFAIGMKMVIWAEFHEGTFGFPREFTMEFLNSSFFTPLGIIDTKIAAEELLECKNLSTEQKYKIACFYCLSYRISSLYEQLTDADKEKIFAPMVKQPDLVRYWSYKLKNEVNQLKGRRTLDLYLLEKTTESGSKAAVEYYLEEAVLNGNEEAIVDAALEASKNRSKVRRDWIVFRDHRFDFSKESWVPNDYYVDIVYFLLPKMREDQQIDFLRRDIDGLEYRRQGTPDDTRSRVLDYFLSWPYQEYFMQVAKLIWEYLPQRNYAVLLHKICDHIEPASYGTYGNVKYGEEKNFNYRKLLKSFWCESPQRFKRYVFRDAEITYGNFHQKTVRMCIGLLVKIFSLMKFNREDEENIRLILTSATDREKENILASKQFRNICIQLMSDENWRLLNELSHNSFAFKEDTRKFQKTLLFSEEAQDLLLNFVLNGKWEVVESIFRWSAISHSEIDNLKRELINSENGMTACLQLISPEDKMEKVDKFVKWFLPLESETIAFRRKLVLSEFGIFKCVAWVKGNHAELANKFIKFGLTLKKEIDEMKKNVTSRVEHPI